MLSSTTATLANAKQLHRYLTGELACRCGAALPVGARRCHACGRCAECGSVYCRAGRVTCEDDVEQRWQAYRARVAPLEILAAAVRRAVAAHTERPVTLTTRVGRVMASTDQVLTAVAVYCELLASQRPGKTFTFARVGSGRMKGWLVIRQESTEQGVIYAGDFMFVGASSGLLYWADRGSRGARVGGGTVMDAVSVGRAVA